MGLGDVGPPTGMASSAGAWANLGPGALADAAAATALPVAIVAVPSGVCGLLPMSELAIDVLCCSTAGAEQGPGSGKKALMAPVSAAWGSIPMKLCKLLFAGAEVPSGCVLRPLLASAVGVEPLLLPATPLIGRVFTAGPARAHELAETLLQQAASDLPRYPKQPSFA